MNSHASIGIIYINHEYFFFIKTCYFSGYFPRKEQPVNNPSWSVDHACVFHLAVPSIVITSKAVLCGDSPRGDTENNPAHDGRVV